jgi:hypothetical protein
MIFKRIRTQRVLPGKLRAAHRCLQISLLMLFANVAVMAQAAPCSLTLASLPPAPELFGLQLGMTKAQVKARIPQVVFGRTDALGVSKTTINPHFDPSIDQSTFTGVRSISLDFLDDKLTSLWIGYDSAFKVNTVEEFVNRVSQSLRLPDAWKAWRSRGKLMNCADFQLTATMVSDGPSFRILDLNAEEVVSNRRKAQAELAETEAASKRRIRLASKRVRVPKLRVVSWILLFVLKNDRGNHTDQFKR